MANLLKTFSAEIDIVNGPVHQVFPEPVILDRTSIVEDYKVISLVANGSFAVVLTVKNNTVLVDLSSPTIATMNASVFDDTTVAKTELASTFDAGLSDLPNGVIGFICPIDTLPSALATGFDRVPAGTIEIDFELKVGGHTEHIYDRVNVIDNAFGGTGGVLPADITQFISKGETFTTEIDAVQLGVKGATAGQTANVFEAVNSAGTTIGGFDQDGFVFGLKDDSVTNAVMSDVSTATIKGRVTAGTGDPEDLTAAQVRTVIDFDAEVDANTSVAANTSKTTNATHTGDVTGSVALTIDKSSISGKSLVTAVSGDHVLIGDSSDSDNLKKVNVSDFLAGSGDMLAATYDPTAVAGDAFLRSNMAGTQLSSTVSDFESTVSGTVRSYTKQQNFGTTTLSDGANISWDLDDNQVSKVTLAGNRTLDNPTNMVDGATYILRVIQDPTGTRTLSYGSAYDFGDIGAPTLTTTADKIDILTFVSDGTSMFGVTAQGFG